MKRKNVFLRFITYIFFFLVILYSFSFFNIYIYANEIESSNLELFCNSGIAMDYETGNILYNNNATKKIYPASTTKILTCILAIENLSIDDTTVISKKVIQNTPYDSSRMGIKAGDLYTIEDLLYGLMLPSGNDSALAIAEAVSGSTSNFVELMNKKIKEIGCNNTHFTNPHGYHDDNHYSTAYDMALIFKYCLKNETFRKIIGTKEVTVTASNSDTTLKLKNSNRMQNPNYTSYYYEYIKGGKTGYTLEARGTFIGYAIKDDKTVIAAAFDGSQNINGLQARFLDTKSLFEYSFNNYSKQMIINSDDYTFKIYDEKNRKCYTIKAEKSIYGLYNTLSNIEYKLDINHEKIDNLLKEIENNEEKQSENNINYLNQIIGSINFKYTLKNNGIITSSNLNDNQNLILINVSDYNTENKINKTIPIIIILFLIGLLFIYLINKKRKKRKKYCKLKSFK